MELKDFIKSSDIKITNNQDDDLNDEQLEELKRAENLYDKIKIILKTIYDPEISINIWDLGLIYNIDASNKDNVLIDMTLTTPLCPVADAMPIMVKEKLRRYLPNVTNIGINMVWEPKWSKDMISEEAKLLLDMW